MSGLERLIKSGRIAVSAIRPFDQEKFWIEYMDTQGNRGLSRGFIERHALAKNIFNIPESAISPELRNDLIEEHEYQKKRTSPEKCPEMLVERENKSVQRISVDDPGFHDAVMRNLEDIEKEKQRKAAKPDNLERRISENIDSVTFKKKYKEDFLECYLKYANYIAEKFPDKKQLPIRIPPKQLFSNLFDGMKIKVSYLAQRYYATIDIYGKNAFIAKFSSENTLINFLQYLKQNNNCNIYPCKTLPENILMRIDDLNHNPYDLSGFVPMKDMLSDAVITLSKIVKDPEKLEDGNQIILDITLNTSDFYIEKINPPYLVYDTDPVENMAQSYKVKLDCYNDYDPLIFEQAEHVNAVRSAHMISYALSKEKIKSKVTTVYSALAKDVKDAKPKIMPLFFDLEAMCSSNDMRFDLVVNIGPEDDRGSTIYLFKNTGNMVLVHNLMSGSRFCDIPLFKQNSARYVKICIDQDDKV